MLRFKNFLESKLDANFAFSYDPATKKWQEGTSGDIYILGRQASEHNPNNYLDIEGIGRNHPQLAEILQTLVNQYPELLDYPIKFDSPASETVNQVIQRTGHTEFTGIPKIFYHGTSTWHYQQIKNQGMLPRNTTGVIPAYKMGAAPSNPELIYLMDNDGNAVRFAAREAASKTKSQPIILKISRAKLNKHKFRPDEDAKINIPSFAELWKQSLWSMGSVAYAGDIPVDAIAPHMILKDNQWQIPENNQ